MSDDDGKIYRMVDGADGRKVPHYRRQYRDPLTRERKSVIGTAEECARVLADVATRKREIAQGLDVREVARRHGAAKGPLTLAEAWEKHISAQGGARHRAKVRGLYRLHVVGYAPFAEGAAEVASLTEQRMDEWLKWTARTCPAAKSRKNLFDLMRAAVRRFIGVRLDALPWGTWRPPPGSPSEKSEACRNIGEVAALVLAAKARDDAKERRGGFGDLRFRVLVLIALALRQGEGCGLGVHDFGTTNGQPSVKIRRQVTPGWIKAFPDADEPPEPPKGKRSRELGMNPTCQEIVRLQIENLKAHGLFDARGPLFPSLHPSAHRRRWRASPSLIAPPLWRELWTEAGLPNAEKAVTHGARTTGGTLGANNGDIEALREFMGHRSAEMTAGYFRALKRTLPESGLVLPGFDVLPALPSAFELEREHALEAAPARLAAGGLAPALDARAKLKVAKSRARSKAYQHTLKAALKRPGVSLAEAKVLAATAARRAGRAVSASYSRVFVKRLRADLPPLLLEAVKARPETAAELCRRLKAPLSTVKDALARLVESGAIHRHGPPRSPCALYGKSAEAAGVEADRRYTGRLDRAPFVEVDRALRARGEASAAELAAELHRPRKAVLYQLAELADASRVRTSGKGPGATWRSIGERASATPRRRAASHEHA